jgi:hypothetical protein
VAVIGWSLLSGALSGPAAACEEPLPPLGTSDLSAEGFQRQDTALGGVLEMLSAGDVAGAQRAFAGEVHNFTHNVDAPVRQHNEELAKEICRTVLDVESSLTPGVPAAELATKMAQLRELIRDAAEALGHPRPG